MLNRLKKQFTLSLMFITLGLFSSSSASEEQIPNYTLEVIVFETFALKSWTEEYWPEELDQLDYENNLFLADVLANPQANIEQRFAAQEIELKEVAKKLSPNKGYKILFHQAWSQNTYADLKMPQLLIEAAHDNTQMAGTVKLYKSRYAHVDFDLRFERRIPDRIKTLFFEQQKITPFDIEPESWQFELRESRKIRPNQLHYIDHPLFGILVQLRYNGPAEEVAPTTAAR